MLIVASYATGVVLGTEQLGGLVGEASGGAIRYSYARTGVRGDHDDATIGGLVGTGGAAINDSYCDLNVEVVNEGAGGINTDESLNKAIDIASFSTFTGALADWSVPVDHDGNDTTEGIRPWNLRGAGEYPVLSVDFDGDGMASWEEFGSQSRHFLSTLSFSSATYDASEDSAQVNIQLNLETPASSAVRVPLLTAGSASDHDCEAPDFIGFETGDRQQTITITITDDDLVEGEETIELQLGSA